LIDILPHYGHGASNGTPIGLEEKVDSHREKADANQKMLVRMEVKAEAHHDRIMAMMDTQLEKMEACLGKTETMNLEASPKEINSETEHQEIPKEEAVVETFGALKKWHGEWHLAIRCRDQSKKRIQGMVGLSRSWPLPAEG
jgi:predicted protein tyrosine phosphatase